MARPGDTFAQRQQYFHKSVVLIIKHDDAGDMGVWAARDLFNFAGRSRKFQFGSASFPTNSH